MELDVIQSFPLDSQNLKFKHTSSREKINSPGVTIHPENGFFNKVERAPTSYLYFSLVGFCLNKNYQIKLTREYEKHAERLCDILRKDAWSPSLKILINRPPFFQIPEDKLEFIRENN